MDLGVTANLACQLQRLTGATSASDLRRVRARALADLPREILLEHSVLVNDG